MIRGCHYVDGRFDFFASLFGVFGAVKNLQILFLFSLFDVMSPRAARRARLRGRAVEGQTSTAKSIHRTSTSCAYFEIRLQDTGKTMAAKRSKRRLGRPTGRSYSALYLTLFFFVASASARDSPTDVRTPSHRLHNPDANNADGERGQGQCRSERFRRRPAAIAFMSNGNDDNVKQNNRYISRHLQSLQDDAKNEAEKQERHAKSHMFSGAMHQVEHRAKEKTSIKLGEKAATQLLKSTERKGLSRLAERLLERIQIIWESVSGRSVERYGERFVERIGERAGERVAERGAVAGQRFLSRAERKIATGVAERAGERAAERTGQRFLSRGERRMATSVAERTGERAGQRMAERAAERGASASSKYSAAARRSIGRHMAELGERTSETGLVLASKGRRVSATAADRASYAAVRTTERMARSVARIFLIALPALGGLFALWLLKADMKRIREVREEREDYEWFAYGTLPSKRRPCLPSTMFAGAALADLVDAVVHFVIAYAVLIELGHSKILKWEEISLACAIVSTLFAIAGEVADWRKMHKYRAVTES